MYIILKISKNFVLLAEHIDEPLTPAPLADKLLENHPIFRVPIVVIPGIVIVLLLVLLLMCF